MNRPLRITLILLASILLSDSSSTLRAEERVLVRVAILEEVSQARVTIATACRLSDLATGKLLGRRPSIRWEEVKSGDAGLWIGDEELPSDAVLVEPEEETFVRVNARPYRGSLILYRTPNGKLTVVNRIDLEAYLVSALPSEVSEWWPLETLKAHAVVSRTLVAHRIWVNRNAHFDVTADTRVHLYGGVPLERDSARRAVKATEAEVLAYPTSGNLELFYTPFHASCGGHTEDYVELWQGRGDLAPLKGKADPYCRNLKHYRWRATLSLKELEDALSGSMKAAGRVRAMEIIERNRSNRVRSIRIIGTDGIVTLSGRDFRDLVGVNRLKSLNFTVTFLGREVVFQGFGWGHGVGLCQWGAYEMARRGKKMDEILSFYFPGAQRRKLQGLPGFAKKD